MVTQSKEFTFFPTWNVSEDELQLRQIGNLRPPNEIIQAAKEVAEQKFDKAQYDPEGNSYVVFGKIKVDFIYRSSGESEMSEPSFSDDYLMKTYNPAGEEVAGEFRRRTSGYSDFHRVYKAYQNKGWLTMDGEFYGPNDSKPEGWSSR